MKKWTILSMALVLTSLSAMAQDDMYFMSSKKQKAEHEASRQTVRQTNSNYERIDYRDYSGSKRNVDEYNRMGSQIETLPADTGDVITFDPVEGVYPDSVGDYQLTKQMTRFDDYVPSIAYWEGYSAGRRDAWGWHSPWYYSSLYPWYDPWYYDLWYGYGWYDPWYYDPWYYNYGWRHFGYYGGYYYGYGYHYNFPIHYVSTPSIRRGSYYTKRTGTQSHGRIVDSGKRSTVYSSTARDRGIGAGRSSTGGVRSAGSTSRTVNNRTTTASSRSNTPINTSIGNGNTRSTSGSVYNSTPTRSSGSSFGGSSRSSGGNIGGGHSSGGSRSAGRGR